MPKKTKENPNGVAIGCNIYPDEPISSRLYHLRRYVSSGTPADEEE
tara:strand:+ start:979 stop:1116 length:138 start_codon:yes stop_codon:yes gene_type:complete